MDAMEALSRSGVPVTWKMLEAVSVAVTKTITRYPKARKNTKCFKEKKRIRMTFSALMILFFARSQKINSFQTMMGVLMSACHTTNVGRQIIHATGFRGSYVHCTGTMQKIAKDNKASLIDWIKNHGGKMNMHNVNRKVGVRDGPGTREALIDNSTVGFVSPLTGLPPRIRMMPCDWMKVTKRVDLEPRDLVPSAESFSIMSQWRKLAMEELLGRIMLKKKLWKFPKPVIEETFPEITPIFPLALMDYEQASIDGNLKCIKHVLVNEMGYDDQELMEGVFLAGGDTMLVSRVRSIRMLRETHVPGEDFKFMLPGLGPLPTVMNYMKMFLKMHLGPSDGSQVGSLMDMNKKLRRQNIDEDATNLVACPDLVKDVCEAWILELLVTNEGYITYADFRSRVALGRVKYEDACCRLEEMLCYNYVSNLRRNREEERDRVFENVLLFVRQGLEVRAFHKSMRSGDVGAM